MAVSEAVERLEAQLRHWKRATRYSESWWRDPWDRPVHPHDPATPEGREWWCEALKLSVQSYGDGTGWMVQTVPASPVRLWVLEERKSRSAYLEAALYPAAQYDGVHPNSWPWGLKYWKPKDRRSNLIRAGALIAAELDRLAAPGAQEGGADGK